jgi:hypothetical protein
VVSVGVKRREEEGGVKREEVRSEKWEDFY